jgi:N6-adenosine-specific RNA methylase IME4
MERKESDEKKEEKPEGYPILVSGRRVRETSALTHSSRHLVERRHMFSRAKSRVLSDFAPSHPEDGAACVDKVPARSSTTDDDAELRRLATPLSIACDLEREATANLLIAEIQIGKRHRKDMGDIAGLAGSIEDVGLLHPVVVTPKRLLIAGERRIAAYSYLGRKKIPAITLDLDKVVRGEYAENTFRKSFTLTEAADIADAIEPIERAAAKARQQQAGARGTEGGRGRKKTLRGNSPEGNRALDKVAKVVGKHRDTIQKARAVRDAAKADPEKFGKLAADMDRTGRADGPFKRLKVMRQSDEIKAAPAALPRGPFSVIVVDPPWPYETRKADPSHRATHPFPQMSIEDICAMPIAEMATPNCILWLWTTNHHMREAFAVLDAWGFQQKTILTWAKDRMGMGDWLRGQTEHCLMAIRGKPIVTLGNHTTLLPGPMRENSRKPDAFFSFVTSLCPAPRGGYVSIFERYDHPGWVLWGTKRRLSDIFLRETS